jgi:hypothetical protein
VPNYDTLCRPLLEYLNDHYVRTLQRAAEPWPRSPPPGDPHVCYAWTWMRGVIDARARRFQAHQYRTVSFRLTNHGLLAQLFNPQPFHYDPLATARHHFSAEQQQWSHLDRTIYGLIWVIKQWRDLLRDNRFFIRTPDSPPTDSTVWTWHNSRLLFERMPRRYEPHANPATNTITIHSDPLFLAAAFLSGRGIQPFEAPPVAPFDYSSPQELSWNRADRLPAPGNPEHPVYANRLQFPILYDADDQTDEPRNPDSARWDQLIDQVYESPQPPEPEPDPPTTNAAEGFQPPLHPCVDNPLDPASYLQQASAELLNSVSSSSDQAPPEVPRVRLRHLAAFHAVHNDSAGHQPAAETITRLINAHSAWNWLEMCKDVHEWIEQCQHCN